MKLEDLQITPQMFYKTGMGCFLVIAVCNICNFFIFFGKTNIPSKISSLGGIVFNFVLIGFFYYLYKQVTPQAQTSFNTDTTPEDIKKEFEEA